MQESVRRLLRLMGYNLEELELAGRKTECCGYGGLMSSANPALGRDAAKRRAGLARQDWVTYCAMCRDSLAREGGKAVHILDLVFGGPEGWKTAPRARPGYSARH
jgi:Fe-S oxidoreductase